MDEGKIVQIAEDYRRVLQHTQERLSVKDFGLGLLDRIMQRGYRVIVSARRTLGYQSVTCGRGCECDFCKVGKGKNTVLQNRKGEIFEVYIPPEQNSNPACIEEMVWYSRGLGSENITMNVEEEDRLEDLLVYDLLPPKKIIPVKKTQASSIDSRQKSLFD